MGKLDKKKVQKKKTQSVVSTPSLPSDQVLSSSTNIYEEVKDSPLGSGRAGKHSKRLNKSPPSAVIKHEVYPYPMFHPDRPCKGKECHDKTDYEKFTYTPIGRRLEYQRSQDKAKIEATGTGEVSKEKST